MTHRILVAGHWSGGSPASSTTFAALEESSRGLLSSAVHWRVELIPFRPGLALKEVVRGPGSPRYTSIVVPDDEQESVWAGRKAKEALELGFVPILEGEHPYPLDYGVGFISSLSGIEMSDSSTLEQTLPHALLMTRQVPIRYDMTTTAPARHPLLGLSPALVVDPEFNVRSMQDRRSMSLFTRLLSCSGEKSLPSLDSRTQLREAGRTPGSGAGGGISVVVHTTGGRIIDTGLLLRTLLRLDERITDADFIVAFETKLHSPNLPDSFLNVICDAAAQHVLPVVAIGEESSLSAHEYA